MTVRYQYSGEDLPVIVPREDDDWWGGVFLNGSQRAAEASARANAQAAQLALTNIDMSQDENPVIPPTILYDEYDYKPNKFLSSTLPPLQWYDDDVTFPIQLTDEYEFKPPAFLASRLPNTVFSDTDDPIIAATILDDDYQWPPIAPKQDVVVITTVWLDDGTAVQVAPADDDAFTFPHFVSSDLPKPAPWFGAIDEIPIIPPPILYDEYWYIPNRMIAAAMIPTTPQWYYSSGENIISVSDPGVQAGEDLSIALYRMSYENT